MIRILIAEDMELLREDLCDVLSAQEDITVAGAAASGGEILKMNVANGGIGLTDMSVMKKALGDKFPEDILTKINELTEKIKSGEIKVESYPGFKFE